MNAYWKWGGEARHLGYLKEEQKVLATLLPEQVRGLLHFKPVRRNETRDWAMGLTALDTGLRLQEVLSLTRQDLNLDNLTILVHGKGNKQRLVPMSVELRKVLFRYINKYRFDRVFCTCRGTAVTPRNADRDFKVVCKKAGLIGCAARFTR